MFLPQEGKFWIFNLLFLSFTIFFQMPPPIPLRKNVVWKRYTPDIECTTTRPRPDEAPSSAWWRSVRRQRPSTISYGRRLLRPTPCHCSRWELCSLYISLTHSLSVSPSLSLSLSPTLFLPFSLSLHPPPSLHPSPSLIYCLSFCFAIWFILDYEHF